MFIFDTAKYPISIYGVCIVVAILIGYVVATIILAKHQVSRLAIVCSTMLNLILLFYFSYFFNYLVNIGKPITNRGITSTGAAVGMLLGSLILYLIFKEPLVPKAYLTVIPLIYSISKLGCFFGGCCGGRLYDGPLAVTYCRNEEVLYGGSRFPVPLLETLVFAIIFATIALLFKKLNFRSHALLNASLCSLAKFVLDFLRDSHTSEIISMNQIVCLAILVITSIVLLIFSQKNKANKMQD